MYDRLMDEYNKSSKEELGQRIMALEEIECSDRSFANSCKSSDTIYNINELFSSLEELRNNRSNENIDNVLNSMNNALNSWNSIVHELNAMSKGTRIYDALNILKEEIENFNK